MVIKSPQGAEGEARLKKWWLHEAGQWRYRVTAANGETLAASEGYTRRADAQRGARDLLATAAQVDTGPPPEPDSPNPHA